MPGSFRPETRARRPSLYQTTAPRTLPALLSLLLVSLAAGDSTGRGFSFGERHAHLFLDLGDRSQADQARSRAGFEAALSMTYHGLEMGLGVAGIYRKSRYPVESAAPSAEYSPWEVGLDQAYLRLPWEMGTWPAAVQAGLFSWTGNPDAVLLGGYLARNGAYPGWIERQPDSWGRLESIETTVLGMRLSAGSPGGTWTHEALVLVDSSYREDERDFSLAYLLHARLPGGLEVGGGLELFRFASTFPEGLAPRHPYNTWVKTDSGYFMEPELPSERIPGPSEDTGYYTRSALILGLRAALDVRELLGFAPRPGREGRLFLEAALLGLRNQPIFYDSPFHRLAVTVGVHLPSFGLLDVFCVQAEWRPARLVWNPIFDPYPVWTSPDERRVEVEQPEPWSFGVLLSKDLSTWLALQGQVLRLPDPGGFRFAGSNDFSRERNHLLLLRLTARY